jgi:hypothetical protein
MDENQNPESNERIARALEEILATLQRMEKNLYWLAGYEERVAQRQREHP